MDDQYVFVTDDAVLVTGRGFIDPADYEVMRKREVWSLGRMLAHIEGEHRERFDQDASAHVRPGETPLTIEEVKRLSAQAPETFFYIRTAVEPFLLAMPRVCDQIRDLRINRRYSWRAISRWASVQPLLAHSVNMWAPPIVNQIAGMALCAVVADLDDEDFKAPPWNDIPPGM